MFEVGRIAMKKRIVCLVLGLVMMFSQTMSVFATTEQQLKQQKSQAQSQLNATNDEIDELSRCRERGGVPFQHHFIGVPGNGCVFQNRENSLLHGVSLPFIRRTGIRPFRRIP